MKAAVIGANGQLGSEIVEQLHAAGIEFVPLVWEQMDIADAGAVREVLGKISADVIINTAAMHNVEDCEKDPLNAFRVNGHGVRNLALHAQDAGAMLIHVSTDYVFDGKKGKPYEESDCPSPLNVYANTKLAGEYFVRSLTEKHYIVRVCGLFGRSPCLAKRGGLNFVDLMLKLAKEKGTVKVVDDERLTPTSALEAARQIVSLISRRPGYGIYHCTAEGDCSWYEFAREIFQRTQTQVDLQKALPGEFPVKVLRPQYSVLENAALKAAGMNQFKHWREGLHEYLQIKGFI